jgi:hypothetical protein
VARKPAGAVVEPAAAAAEVEDLDGRKVRLDSLWRTRIVVLVFLRHFG